jgi:hypothetical protein
LMEFRFRPVNVDTVLIFIDPEKHWIRTWHCG